MRLEQDYFTAKVLYNGHTWQIVTRRKLEEKNIESILPKANLGFLEKDVELTLKIDIEGNNPIFLISAKKNNEKINIETISHWTKIPLEYV